MPVSCAELSPNTVLFFEIMNSTAWPPELEHVTVIFTVTVPPAVTPEYAVGAGAVHPVGRFDTAIAPPPSGTLLTV